MDKKLNQYKKSLACDLVITERCMLRCKMCNMWQVRTKEVDIKVWEEFIDSLFKFTNANLN